MAKFYDAFYIFNMVCAGINLYNNHFLALALNILALFLASVIYICKSEDFKRK